MSRSFWAVAGVVCTGFLTSPLFATGCKTAGVGNPCVPEQEYNADFNGFDEQEVNVESKSFTCQTRLCLVNHFQGRTSCPYGQDENGTPPSSLNGKDTAGNPVGPCVVPGTSDKITGSPDPNNKAKAKVAAACIDRTPDKAVYCSCRCADIFGNTNDGANYCTCPDGFTCEQLVTSIGQGDTGLTGAYCIKNGTQYNRTNACVECAATVKPACQPE